MATVEERLQRLEDEEAILATLYAYGHDLDYGREAEWLDCWTDDAVLDWPGRDLIVGQAALRAAFRGHTHAPALYHKHVVVEPRIRIEGDRATVVSMYARLDRYRAGPQIRAFGRYRDVLVRCADGRWRFKERYPDVEAVRKEPPLGGAPFPDPTEAQKHAAVLKGKN